MLREVVRFGGEVAPNPGRHGLIRMTLRARNSSVIASGVPGPSRLKKLSAGVPSRAPSI
ncbi:hypothetical protein [Thioclava sp.]|uniref:hypothetical protein n=1 Tax=Thioclava sp. TaxID=1933450 RepID=UPI003AA934EF